MTRRSTVLVSVMVAALAGTTTVLAILAVSGLTADLFRYLAMVLTATAVGLTATIIRRYSQVWRLVPTRAGLLPAHVALIASTHLIFMVSALLDMLRFLGDPMTWRVPVFSTASSLTCVALWIISEFSGRRVQGTQAEHVVVETTSEVSITNNEGNATRGKHV